MAVRKNKTLLDQAQEYVDAVRPHVESAVITTRDAVGGFVENTAKPAITDARDKAGPVVADAKAKAAPAVAAGVAMAATKAAEAKEAADARVASVRGEEPAKKKGGRLKKVALFAAIAGALGFVAKKLQSGKQTDNWQSSYVPKPAPASAPVKDAGGSAPDEAIADAADDPQPVTTPDDPADVVDIADQPAAKTAKKA